MGSAAISANRLLGIRLPQLLENVLLIAHDYLTWYVTGHVALIGQTARQRLAGPRLPRRDHRRKVLKGLGCVTNEEADAAANVTSFTASRLLSEWQDTGAIVKQRGKILLYLGNVSR